MASPFVVNVAAYSEDGKLVDIDRFDVPIVVNFQYDGIRDNKKAWCTMWDAEGSKRDPSGGLFVLKF